MITKKIVSQLSYDIIGAAIKVHKELGPGLLESVYEECLKYQLEKEGHKVIQQLKLPVKYQGMTLETQLRLDLLVDDLVIVELKTAENLLPVYKAQVLTYMQLLQKPQGLLINFFSDNITKSMKPFVNKIFAELPD